MDEERYYLLVEPTLGETPEEPGGLFRLRRKTGRLWVEVFVQPDLWRQAPGLISHVVGEDVSSVEVTAEHAEALIAQWPWPGFRGATAAA